MSSIQETYIVSKTVTLIDLNELVTNFNIEFDVSEKDNSDFYISITDQDTLDGVDGMEVEYKEVSGSITGTIRNDKNQYKSYMMALKSKSDENCHITVKTTFQSLPDNITPYIPTPDEPIPTPPISVDKKRNIPLKYVIIGIVVLIGLCLLYYFYYYGDSTSNTNSEVLSRNNFKQTKSFVTEVPNSSLNSNTGSCDIFEKLRNLPIQ